MTGGGWDDTDPQGYVSFEVCARTEAISLVYTEGTSYNYENSVRVTDADGRRREWGPNFTDASGNSWLEMTTGELITIETTSVSRGTDCNDTDASIGTGDLDGDGYDACDTENPFDCDDGNATVYPGAAYLESDQECMTDADADGYGDANPTGGATAGLDCLYHGVFANNSKYRKEILPKYRRVREKPKWKKLSRKDGSKSRHVAWAQLLWRSFGVMGWTCAHCKRMMRLRAVAIYPPATTKILQGLGVNLRGLGFTGPP